MPRESVVPLAEVQAFASRVEALACEFNDVAIMLDGNPLYRHGNLYSRSPDECEYDAAMRAGGVAAIEVGARELKRLTTALFRLSQDEVPRGD